MPHCSGIMPRHSGDNPPGSQTPGRTGSPHHARTPNAPRPEPGTPSARIARRSRRHTLTGRAGGRTGTVITTPGGHDRESPRADPPGSQSPGRTGSPHRAGTPHAPRPEPGTPSARIARRSRRHALTGRAGGHTGTAITTPGGHDRTSPRATRRDRSHQGGQDRRTAPGRHA
jgi:hypothetical protein